MKAIRVTLGIGALGAVVLMLLGGHPPLFLRILMGIWVVIPYAVLAWANAAAPRWPARLRATVTALTLGVVGVTLAIYVLAVLRPREHQPAAPFVLTPVVACIVIALTLAAASLTARRNRE